MTSVKGAFGLLIAGSMLMSSAASAAANVPATQINPWAALSAMSAGAPAVAMCGTAATAAQPAGGCVLPALDAPPPMAQPGQTLPPVVAPPAAVAASGAGSVLPLLAALAVIVAAAGIYGLSKASGNLGPLPPPNSPG